MGQVARLRQDETSGFQAELETRAVGTGVVEGLLARMRKGDRAAAGEFMDRYGSRIRRRVRFKLSQPMRRLFDSQEILSTVARRLDLCVDGDQIDARLPEELWSLVFRMADNALIDRVRVFRRLQAVEGSDSRFAQALLGRVRDAERVGGFEIEMDKVFQAVENPVDREILSLWLCETPHPAIAQQTGITPASVRQRWQRLREKLRSLIEDGLL